MLSYIDFSLTAPKKLPVVLMEMLNGLSDKNNSLGYIPMEYFYFRFSRKNTSSLSQGI